MNPLDTIKGTIIAGFVLALVLGVLTNIVTGKGKSAKTISAHIPAAVISKK